MKTLKNLTLCCAAITVMCSTHIFAAGLLKPVNQSQDTVSIVSHDVSVLIQNGFAQTVVDQVFTNTSATDCDAVYSFPLPDKARLSELSLWIDGNEVIGEVLEKERARAVHEKQKAQGNDTALAEKQSFKTFDVSVSPVRAGKPTRVRLVYYQPLNIDLNIGRYVYPLEEGGVDEDRISFWSVDDIITGTFSFNLTLKSAFPVQTVRLPGYENDAVISHHSSNDVDDDTGEEGTQQTNNGLDTIYTVTLEKREDARLSKDIVFYYKLDDSVPARVEIIPYKEASSPTGTFMAIVTPGASVARITQGIDWTFVLDTSGSMNGHKIKMLCDGIEKIISQLNQEDRIRIVTFNNSATDITGGYIPMTKENITRVLDTVRRIQAGGGTALYAGLLKGLESLDDDRTTGIILISDGVCNIGPTEHAEFLKLLRSYDVRLFTFIMGNSANRPLLERLAESSYGFAMNVSMQDDLVGKILKAKVKLSHQCMRDVSLTFNGIPTHGVTPQVTKSLYAGKQLVVFGRYTQSGELIMTFNSTIDGEEGAWTCSIDMPNDAPLNPEIERLWAYACIDEIMKDIRETGETRERRDAVISLGTAYSLVTDYTSMVVINDTAAEEENLTRRNSRRIQKERNAQAQRAQRTVKKHTVRNKGGKSSQPQLPSLNIGSGPFGCVSLALVAWMRLRKRFTRG